MVLENDYWLLPAILERANLAPYRQDRTGPMVMVGGVGIWSNPWPLIPFVDLVLAGEGEYQWPVIVDLFSRKDFLKLDHAGRLFELQATVPGALAPGLWSPDQLRELGQGPTAAVKPSILKWPFDQELLPPSSPILTKATEFPETTLVEISRGCPWGCRFCLAGHIYRPHRPWASEAILKAAFSHKESGGRVGLVSPAVADHPDLSAIIKALSERKISIGVSSMRLSALTEPVARRLSDAGLKALAVAPEAGSQRLRDIINKNLTDLEILDSARLLAGRGLRRLKLYFMTGLPGEIPEDLEGMTNLVARIQKATRVGRGGPRLSVSISNFTPKPQTPFEDCPLSTEKEMRARGREISRLLSGIDGVELRLDPPVWTIVQGLLARGGPESHLLVKAMLASFGRAGGALKAIGYGPSHPIHSTWSSYKPWRLIDCQVGVSHLALEAESASRAEPSAPCPPGGRCGRCQACEGVIL
jgi:radical SAM superfamily enzyme YgiQ (UPF0313 family)